MHEELRRNRHESEQTYAFMLASIGALVASQLLLVSDAKFMVSEAFVYAIGALAALWFPARGLLSTMEMFLISTYVRDVLAPKLNNLTALAATEAQRQGLGQANHLMGLHSATRASSQDIEAARFPVHPMSWEEFHPWLRKRFFVFPTLHTFVQSFLYIPMVALTWLFVVTSNRSWPAVVLLITVIGLGAVCAALHLWVYAAFVGRRGPFVQPPK